MQKSPRFLYRLLQASSAYEVLNDEIERRSYEPSPDAEVTIAITVAMIAGINSNHSYGRANSSGRQFNSSALNKSTTPDGSSMPHCIAFQDRQLYLDWVRTEKPKAKPKPKPKAKHATHMPMAQCYWNYS